MKYIYVFIAVAFNVLHYSEGYSAEALFISSNGQCSSKQFNVILQSTSSTSYSLIILGKASKMKKAD